MDDQRGGFEGTEQERPSDETIHAVEHDLLSSMLGAAKELESETQVVAIRRNGKPAFYFRVRGLSEKEDSAARKASTSYNSKQRFAGMRVPDDFDNARYRSLLIIKATVAFCEPVQFETKQVKDVEGNYTGEVRQIAVAFNDVPSMWDNAELREQLGVRDKVLLVDRILSAGEKAHVVEVIEKLSGYGDDYEDDLGN